MKNKMFLIILIIFVFSFGCFIYLGIKYYHIQILNVLKNENNQVDILKDMYENFLNGINVYGSESIYLDHTCLTNIIDNTKFNDNNIKKLKELEKNNVEHKLIYILYSEYNKENSILKLTLKETHGIQEYNIKYKLYVKENKIKYEVDGYMETMFTTPSKEF